MLRELLFAVRSRARDIKEVSSSPLVDERVLGQTVCYRKRPEWSVVDASEFLGDDAADKLRAMRFKGDKDGVFPEASMVFTRGAQTVEFRKGGGLTATTRVTNSAGNRFVQTIDLTGDGRATNILRDLGRR
jgi:hypothetical protein